MPKIIDHDVRRGELLDASLALFSRLGFSGISMRRLATELSVSTGALYHYFPNKSALFESMLYRLAQSDVGGVVAQIEPRMSRAERLHLVMEFVISSAGAIREIIDVLTDYRRTVGPDGDELVRRVLDVYRASLTKYLMDGDEEGADLVLSVIIGVLMHSELRSAPEMRANQIRRLLPLAVPCDE